jgi:tetratricopeptide (TPR) repeat protein
VASTWALSFKNIEQANPAAAELLRFCAFMHPNGIPEEVFSEGAPELGPILGPAGKDAFALDGAISAILKYSLLCRDPDTHTLEIHRLVQAALKQGVDENTQRPWAERAVRAVNRAFPSVEFSNWPRCERLLAQAHACAELIKQWGFEFPEAARLLNDTGFYMYERGRYTDSKPLYQQALEIRKKVLGTEHPDVATSLNDLGMLYEAQGQYAQAEPLLEQALAIREHVLGTEHNDVAESLRGLALLYADQGQYAKAEPLYQRALAIQENALGSKHPDVARNLYCLAALYHNQGQYAKAESLYQQALAIQENALGPEHPDVATVLENYALLLRKMDRPEEAEPLESRARVIREKPR